MGIKKKLLSIGLAALFGMKVLMPIEVKADDLNKNSLNLENITKIEESKKSKRKTNILEIGAYGVGAYGLTLAFHEGGHYLAGFAFGTEDLEIDLFPRKEDNDILIAYVKRKGFDLNVDFNKYSFMIGLKYDF